MYTGKLINLLRQVLFEPMCPVCGSWLTAPQEEILCAACEDEIKPFQGICCRYCGKFLDYGSDLCGDCMLASVPGPFNRSFGVYAGILREVILSYKYGNVYRLRKILSRCLFRVTENMALESVRFVIPVPEDPARNREYAPVPELARLLAKKMRIPLLTGTLIKTRPALPQASLTYGARIKNLNGAFAVKNTHRLRGCGVLLVDDIYTTGTTVKQCVLALEKNGCHVRVVTLARSV